MSVGTALPVSPERDRQTSRRAVTGSSMKGLQVNVYTAAAGTPTADALTLLGSWAASQEKLPSEAVATT
jgi:hypothetical protein